MTAASQRFRIEGMSCAGCAAKIQRTLAKDTRNQGVAVNFAAKTATLQSDHAPAEIQNTIAGLGYAATPQIDQAEVLRREAKQLRQAKRDALVAALLAAPTAYLGMSVMAGGTWMGDAAARSAVPAVQWALTSLVLVGPGRGFFLRAWRQLRHGQTSMDTLVALGAASAYGFSLYLWRQGQPHLYFESSAVIIALILVGKFLEERARQSIAMAVRELLKLQPTEATLIAAPGEAEGKERRVPVSSLQHGAWLLVRPGDRFPVDGIVKRGESAVDASMLTGESLPIQVTAGSKIAAGTTNLTGPLSVETTSLGEDTELARIVALVEAAQGTKAPVQKLADQVSGWFVPAALAVALLTLGAWLALGKGLEPALSAAVAVLVVACPCALGLATPVAIMAGTGRAARRGILIKDAAALEVLHKVKVLVFDKTGTLTYGKPEVRGVDLLGAEDERAVLAWAGALEAGSNHPLAQAITAYVRQRGGTSGAQLTQVQESPGFGVRGQLAGNPPLSLQMGKLEATSGLQHYAAAQDLAQKHAAQTCVALARGGDLVALFRLQDQLRPEAKASLEALVRAGIKPVMATGDSALAAAAVAQELGSLEVRANQSPSQKAALIQEFRSAGQCVAMAGDGINDAPALAAADVGLAMGSGTDAAMAAAGITLKEPSIAKVVEAVRISQLTFRNIKQNLAWAFAYNVLLIPAAALGQMSPMLAAGAMALSSLFVVGNALRLKGQI